MYLFSSATGEVKCRELKSNVTQEILKLELQDFICPPNLNSILLVSFYCLNKESMIHFDSY